MKTINDIRQLDPCYDPSEYLPEDWQGDSISILEHEFIPPLDKIWVVKHWLDDRTVRLFAVWCAREALKTVENPDPRSVNACNVAERFANGQASSKELSDAYAAAYAASAYTYTASASACASASAAYAYVSSSASAYAYVSSYASTAAYADREDFLYRAIGQLYSTV